MKMAAAAAIIPAVDRGSCSTTCTFMAMEHNYKNQIVTFTHLCRVGNQIAANSTTDFRKVQRRVSALCYYTMPGHTERGYTCNYPHKCLAFEAIPISVRKENKNHSSPSN